VSQISGRWIASANLKSALLWEKSWLSPHLNPTRSYKPSVLLSVHIIDKWTLCRSDFLFPTSHRAPNTPFKMGIVSFITGFVAPIFIIISPITSYADQTYSIHRTKSSAGFSLDITLIMLVASMLRCAGTSGFPNQVILTEYLQSVLLSRRKIRRGFAHTSIHHDRDSISAIKSSS
jgi:hypothetical protein